MSVASKFFACSMSSLALPLTASLANAAIYATRTDFNAANPDVLLEDFEDCSSVTASFTGPLNSSTNNSACQSGDIVDGISFVDEPGPGPVGMYIAGPGQSSNPTTALGQFAPPRDSLSITFADGTSALALDIFQNFGGGRQTGSTQLYAVTLFDLSNTFYATYVTAVPSGGPGFFGADFNTLIGRALISYAGTTPALEVIDNVAFVRASEVNQVPEPATLALLGLGLAGLAAARRRQ